MPVVFREGGLRFHFYSSEGSPLEPPHIHVAKPGADAKLWLRPEVRVAKEKGFTARELRQIVEIVIRRCQEIEDAWNAHFARSNQS